MLTDKSTIEAIKKSLRQVTILFSDIEHSTRHWERRGDIGARLLLDRHNRLLFPIIRKFRGRVIKTLGDGIMAAFKQPEDALKAGIAIQQRLADERNKDKYFSLRTRIGIHTGTGIVEYDDIFGDVVNVAAKVESAGSANQILITQSTQARINSRAFILQPSPGLSLTGKRKPIAVFSCDWQQHENLIENIKPDALTPLLKQQKFELISYVGVVLVALFFIYQHYLRYWLSYSGLNLEGFTDNQALPSGYLLIIALQILLLASFIIYTLRINFISRTVLRSLSGFFGAGLTIIIFASFNHYTELPFKKRWYNPIYESKQQFVEVLRERTPVKETPGHKHRPIKYTPEGEIFIYLQSRIINGLQWSQVKIGPQESGWIPQRILPAFGVAEEKLIQIKKFSIRYYDVYGLILAIMAFIWGFMNFRIQPS